MPESRSSDPARGQRSEKPRDYSAAYLALGIIAMAMGAGLFHPGAGLLLAGVALTGIAVFGAPRRTS